MAESTETPISRKAKHGKCRKAVKIILISISSLVVLLTVCMAIAINFVLTPGRITPMVEKIANEQLNAAVHIGKVELTFFSTYPRVELAVEDGLMVSKAFKDSCFEKTDTLLRFSRCRLNVNIGAYLKKKRLAVRELVLDSVHLYVFRAADGRANYDLFDLSTDTAYSL